MDISTTHGTTPPSPQGYRILVVDDNKVLREKIQRILRSRGYAVAIAPDGVDALRICQDSPPDLIISDVLMPRSDGWTFVRKLRETEKGAFVPVIFLSSQKTTEDLLHGFRLGADDYLLKPVMPRELLSRVEWVLARRRHLEEAMAPELSAEVAPEPDQEGAVPTSGQHALAGNLKDVSLSSLLSLIELERKTGLLTLERRTELGQILVREGRVVQAGLVDPTGPDAEVAVYYMLSWELGSFRFVTKSVAVENQINRPTSMLLLEGARVIDELCSTLGRSTETIRRAFLSRSAA